MPLTTLATNLVNRLPEVLGLDGVAILHFGRDATRSVAASGALQWRFRATRALSPQMGKQVADRAAACPWLEAVDGRSGRSASVDLAYVPFRLGPILEPLGCLVFGLQPGALTGPLSHRLRRPSSRPRRRTPP